VAYTHSMDTGVRFGHGEWDSEYASFVNASLPFEDCAAHVGGEGWGWQGVFFRRFAGTQIAVASGVIWVIVSA
jgi:hypothetical protein